MAPLPATLVNAGEPPTPSRRSVKLPRPTPVTASLKVTFQTTLDPFVGDGLVSAIDVTLGAVVSLTIVAVVEPVLRAASVTQIRTVFDPTARAVAGTDTATCAGVLAYVPPATDVPVPQVVPPTRTWYMPFSVACHPTTDEPLAPMIGRDTPSTVTIGGAVSTLRSHVLADDVSTVIWASSPTDARPATHGSGIAFPAAPVQSPRVGC